MRCAGHLDRAPGARALGHDPVRTGRDVVVLRSEDEPTRNRPPQGAIAGRLEQAALGDGSLGGCHECGLLRGQIGGELVVEPVLRDVGVRASVAERHALERLGQRRSRRERGCVARALTRLEGEAGDVDERRQVAGVGIDVGHDRSAVGVPGEQDRSVDGADEVAQCGGIRRDAAQRVGPRDDAVPVGGQ